MLDLNQHNKLRVQFLNAQAANLAGVACPACFAEMVVNSAIKRTGGPAPMVDVVCPRCGATGEMAL